MADRMPANRFTEIAEGVRRRLQARIDWYREHPQQPAMTERLSARQAWRAYQQLAPEARAAMVRQVGPQGIIDLHDAAQGSKARKEQA